MAKAGSKRGHKTKAEDVLARKATQHHDFVGQAEEEREQSRQAEQQRIRRDQQQLEKEVVQEMATELEQMAGVAEPPRAEPPRIEPPRAEPLRSEPRREEPPRGTPPFEMPRNLRQGIDLLRQRGPEVFDALRAKAEQRLEQMPAPVRSAVHLTERAVGLALWPVRAGVSLMGRVLETPAALVRILLAPDGIAMWSWGGPEGLRSRAVRSLVREVLRPIAAGGRKARPALPSGRRMLLLHLDGVGSKQLESALREGYAPNVAQLLDSGRYRVSPCRAGAPTSTPAFQAGLLYGCDADIPGYTWYDKRRRAAVRMDSSEDARRLEADLQQRGDPLLRDGSVYCSIFSGGAPRRWALSGIFEKLTAQDFGWDGEAPKASLLRDLGAAALVHTTTAGRIAGALTFDIGSGLVETARWGAHVGSLQHEPQFLFHRVLTECLFSEFAANATVIDVARGTPIVYACFIGYDEYAHRRGPYSRMAMLKLFELDRALGRILAAVDAVPELGYEIYLFSDHGQAATRPAEQIVGESLGEHLLSDTPSQCEHVRPVAFGGAGGGDAAAAAAHARWLRALARTLPGALGKAALGWARHTAKALDAGQPAGVRADGPLLVVPAGDIAHLYSTEAPDPCVEAELRARHPGLLERCANSPVVGVALVRGAQGPIALRNGRRFELDRAGDAAEVSRLIGHPLAATYCKDLLALRSAGDVILIGAGAGQTVAYPWEFGSHGGLAADELETFVVHPAELGEDPFAHVVRPRELHTFFRARMQSISHWRGEERRAAAR